MHKLVAKLMDDAMYVTRGKESDGSNLYAETLEKSSMLLSDSGDAKTVAKLSGILATPSGAHPETYVIRGEGHGGSNLYTETLGRSSVLLSDSDDAETAAKLTGILATPSGKQPIMDVPDPGAAHEVPTLAVSLAQIESKSDARVVADVRRAEPGTFADPTRLRRPSANFNILFNSPTGTLDDTTGIFSI